MKITLFINAFNSLSQAIFVSLKDRGHLVDVTYVMSQEKMQEQSIQELEDFSPQLILCPFLKSYIPKHIYQHYPTYIFHPAPRGDRGAYSLDHALFEGLKRWGAVWLKADELYDGGDIYAEQEFELPARYKASLYRQEVSRAAVDTLDSLLIAIEDEQATPQLLNPIHESFTQSMRSIDWERDTTQEIITKIHCSDSLPGVLDTILGVECYLFGVYKEEKLRGESKELLAKRDGAICLGTRDGALWVTHLKERGGFKLPATYILKERIKGLKEDRLALLFDKSYSTFYETSVEFRDDVAYLCFDFHNGAMSTAQCIKLKYAVEYLKSECKVLVFVGGMDFFSNGIHLNILEDSQKQGEDGWANINAMNDLIHSILFADEVVTVASFARNAGAGGVFLGLACDFVVGKSAVVLNPHYKSLGLSGSEYHSYTLPKRVGQSVSARLLDDALPISVEYAQQIGMVDRVYAHEDYYEQLHHFSQESYSVAFIWEKQDFLEENREKIEAHKELELKHIYPQFWEKESAFHRLRAEFVYKSCPQKTPERLKFKETKRA